MTLQIKELGDGKILQVHVSGKLQKEDYQHFVPLAEKLIAEHGKIRVLFDMQGFHGWELGALWEDIKFDLKHFKDIERLALIGDSKWEKGMATFCKPFTTATIRYFDVKDAPAAKSWIEAPA